MDIETSDVIVKITSMKARPVAISGYPAEDQGEGDEKIRLYPSLDPSFYFVFDKSCIIDVLPTIGNHQGHVTVLLDPDCELERVSRDFAKAAALEDEGGIGRMRRPKRPRFEDTLSLGCELLEDEAEQLLEEYRRDSTTNARRKQILERLREIGRTWDQIGCRALFGDIVAKVAPTDTGEGVTLPEIESIGIALSRLR
jgi:hypothetical protein